MNIAEMKIVLLKGQVFFKLIQIKLCICISQDCTQQGLPFTIICFVLLSSTWKIISATQPPPPTPTPSSMAQPTLSTVRLHAGCLPGGGVPLNVAALSAGQSSRHLLTVIFVHSISPPYVQSSVLTSLVQFQTFDSQIWISTDVTLS